jgi:hypothetical protein
MGRTDNASVQGSRVKDSEISIPDQTSDNQVKESSYCSKLKRAVLAGRPLFLLEKFILRLNAMNQATGGLSVRWDVAVKAEP